MVHREVNWKRHIRLFWSCKMASLAKPDRLPWHRKLSYGVADLGFSITGTLIGVYFLVFLTDVVGLQPALAGLAILVAKQWDWINDPIIGHISDRTRSRWGRRRPFLLFGFIPFGILFTLLWWKAPITQQGLLAVYYAGILMFYDTVATFSYMPYFALTPDLTDDYDERTSLTA
jgi:glycoside/pentoside/hexuronide:cation symporter, GPH family